MPVSFPNLAVVPADPATPDARNVQSLSSGTPNEGGAGGGGPEADFQSMLLGESNAQGTSPQAIVSSPPPSASASLGEAKPLAAFGAGLKSEVNAGTSAQSGSVSAFWTVTAPAAGRASKGVGQRASAKAPTETVASGAPGMANVGELASMVQIAPVQPVALTWAASSPPAAARYGEATMFHSSGGDPIPALDTASSFAGQTAPVSLHSGAGILVQNENAAVAAPSPNQSNGAEGGSGEVKIAGLKIPEEAGLNGGVYGMIKGSLGANNQQNTKEFKVLGTSVAMPTPTMTTAAAAQPSAISIVGGLSGASGEAAASAPPADVAQPPATLAVEAALEIGDLQAAASQGTQSAVNLRFNVAGEDLAVRVALQAGQVHTQFTTSSGELRTALAHEWQAFSSLSGGQTRLAEPVFTAGSRSESRTPPDLGGNAGQQSGQNRERSESEASRQKLMPISSNATQSSTAPTGPDSGTEITAAPSAILQSFA